MLLWTDEKRNIFQSKSSYIVQSSKTVNFFILHMIKSNQ